MKDHKLWLVFSTFALAITSPANGQEEPAKTTSPEVIANATGCPRSPSSQQLSATTRHGVTREVHLTHDPESREACITASTIKLSPRTNARGTIYERERTISTATLTLARDRSRVSYISPTLHHRPLYQDGNIMIFATAMHDRRAAKQRWIFWRVDTAGLHRLGEWDVLEETAAGIEAGKACGAFDWIKQTKIDAKADKLRISACKGGVYSEVGAVDLSAKITAKPVGPPVSRTDGSRGCPSRDQTTWRTAPIAGRGDASYEILLGWNEGTEKACVAAVYTDGKTSALRASGSVSAGYLARYDEYTAPKIDDIVLANEHHLVFTTAAGWMGRSVVQGGTHVELWRTYEGRLQRIASWDPETLKSCKAPDKPWKILDGGDLIEVTHCEGATKRGRVFKLSW